MSHTTNKKAIEEEDWKKAKGITESAKNGTNGGLAERDYSVKCAYPFTIDVIHGYHIWWCSAHHQPLPWCERAKQKIEALEFASAIREAENRKDDIDGPEPPKRTRWMTVLELADAFASRIVSRWH